MWRFKFFTLLIPALLLTGCFEGRDRDESDKILPAGATEEEVQYANSSFELKDIQLVDKPQFEPFEKQYNWKIPKVRHYRFKACVQDRNRNTPLIGHTFSVEKGKQVYSGVTSNRGCFEWRESISFNMLGENQYVYEKRVIRGSGMHTGLQPIYLFINPWNAPEMANDQEVVWVARKDDIADLPYLNLNVTADAYASDPKRQLWMDNLKSG